MFTKRAVLLFLGLSVLEIVESTRLNDIDYAVSEFEKVQNVTIQNLKTAFENVGVEMAQSLDVMKTYMEYNFDSDAGEQKLLDQKYVQIVMENVVRCAADELTKYEGDYILISLLFYYGQWQEFKNVIEKYKDKECEETCPTEVYAVLTRFREANVKYEEAHLKEIADKFELVFECGKKILRTFKQETGIA